MFYGDGFISPPSIISFITSKMVWKGVQGLLAHMQYLSLEVLRMDQVPMVREFMNVFLEDLLGLPPKREIEFSVELVLGTKLILIAPMELKELKK